MFKERQYLEILSDYLKLFSRYEATQQKNEPFS